MSIYWHLVLVQIHHMSGKKTNWKPIEQSNTMYIELVMKINTTNRLSSLTERIVSQSMITASPTINEWTNFYNLHAFYLAQRLIISINSNKYHIWLYETIISNNSFSMYFCKYYTALIVANQTVSNTTTSFDIRNMLDSSKLSDTVSAMTQHRRVFISLVLGYLKTKLRIYQLIC